MGRNNNRKSNSNLNSIPENAQTLMITSLLLLL
ncbi:hypothetical protein VSDKYIMU_CDS0192 [Enterococcus phage VRE9_4]